MIALLTTYLLGLLFFAFKKEQVANHRRLRMAWVMLALIALCQALFTLIHALAFTSDSHDLAENLALVEVWKEGAIWLLFAIGLLFLMSALVPGRTPDNKLPESPAPEDPSAPKPGSPAHPSRHLQ
jgi:hypothetical protein